ncbi:hypothetical protein VTN00DRAFT_8441 [Thermoascus crustaceus]|uniref:uncharacterized protein n=1 Tax=Thermoascus crustaceus TaxID=5088 RepID=UPI0037429F47
MASNPEQSVEHSPPQPIILRIPPEVRQCIFDHVLNFRKEIHQSHWPLGTGDINLKEAISYLYNDNWIRFIPNLPQRSPPDSVPEFPELDIPPDCFPRLEYVTMTAYRNGPFAAGIDHFLKDVAPNLTLLRKFAY